VAASAPPPPSAETPAAGEHPPHAPLGVEGEGMRLEPRRTGHRMVDLAIAAAAILISLSSLGVAIHLGHVQQRLVAANSWPFLEFESYSSSGANRPQVVSVGISNDGAGPAVLKSLVVRYRGIPIRGWVELLQECCGLKRGITKDDLGEDLGMAEESRLVGVVRSREKATLLALTRTSANTDLWQRFSAARGELTFDACYCSIVGDCWHSDLRTLDPQPVAACHAGASDYLEMGAGLDGDWKLPVAGSP
jgi:hypothetical protein